MALKGHPAEPARPQPKQRGWHPLDWGCELAGTAFQLFLGFSLVALLESAKSPLPRDIPSQSLRLVMIGIGFGALAAMVALSPLGRRSGAHLNPAVTLAFALRGHTTLKDLAAYSLAQTVGAIAAAAAFVGVWGPWARSVKGAQTLPAHGLAGWAVVGVEASLTFGLLAVILLMVSSPRTASWTPAVVSGALAGLIWVGAPHTGPSMNPARTFGPALLALHFRFFWAYVAGPLAGSALAVGSFNLLSGQRRTLTAKLFHDPEYPSVHATALPTKPLRRS